MDIESLVKFLKENAKDQAAVGHAIETILVFSKIVDSGAYGLMPAADANIAKIAGAISAVLSQPVKKVVLISAASADLNPVSGKVERESKPLWNDIEASLWDCLHSKHKLSLWEGFARPGRKPRDLGNELWQRLEDAIGRDLKRTVGKSLPCRRLGHDLIEACENHCWYALFYYTGFCLNGNAERVQRLAALMDLLPKAIPLGEKRGEPGTWYVLVA